MSVERAAASLAGLDIRAVGERALRDCVLKAMERLGLEGPAYLALLGRDPLERRRLAGEAVVQETWLFRDPDMFAALGRFAAGLGKPVRLLCVPCSTGEEPASASVSLVKAGLSPSDFAIDAADANPQALARARTGRFGASSVRSGLAAAAPHLRPGGEGATLDPALLARIRHIEADVLDESFLAGEPPYQAVICRHLLIYLTGAARERLAANVGRLLAPGGALFTSPAEAAAFARLGLEPHGRGITPERPPLPACQPAVRAASPRLPREPEPAPAADSEAPAALLDEARRLADAGRLQQALALLDEALSSGRPTAGHYHLKGAALLALGREDEAEQALRRALYLDPAHLESLSHLEHLARARGRDREAGLLAVRARKAGEAMP